MSQVIRNAVSAAVERELDAEVSSWGRMHERRWSWQLPLHVAGPSGGDLILKIPRWEEAPTLAGALAAGEQESTRQELDGLRRIQAAVASAGDPGLTAVAPIAYVAELNGILMRRLAGEPLARRLGIRGRRSDAALFSRIGRWIKVFHGIDGAPPRRPFDAEAETGRLDRLESRLGDGRAPSGLGEALSALRQASERLDGVEEPVAEIHGDLNASNVIVGRDDRVAVVDPNREMGPALDDPAHLLVDVRLSRSQLMTGGLMRPGSVVDSWRGGLLEAAGYASEPAAEFRLARRAVERWVEMETEVTGLRRAVLPLARFLVRREVGARVAPLL